MLEILSIETQAVSVGRETEATFQPKDHSTGLSTGFLYSGGVDVLGKLCSFDKPREIPHGGFRN